jgi:hypothetical protein
MSAIFSYQAQRLNEMLDSNNDTQAHIYLEQLLLFPVDIQDKIIEDISSLKNCTSDAIARIIGHHSIIELK